jgi:glutaredoxin
MDIERNFPPEAGPAKEQASAAVILYTRVGCHLCDEAKQQMRELQKRIHFEFREIDIDQDPELRQKYNHEVPVIFIHGKKAFKYRIDAKQFVKRLERGRD